MKRPTVEECKKILQPLLIDYIGKWSDLDEETQKNKSTEINVSLSMNDMIAIETVLKIAEKSQEQQNSYEDRLKTEKLAMLDEIQSELEEDKLPSPTLKTEYDEGLFDGQNGMIKEIEKTVQSLRESITTNEITEENEYEELE